MAIAPVFDGISRVFDGHASPGSLSPSHPLQAEDSQFQVGQVEYRYGAIPRCDQDGIPGAQASHTIHRREYWHRTSHSILSAGASPIVTLSASLLISPPSHHGLRQGQVAAYWPLPMLPHAWVQAINPGVPNTTLPHAETSSRLASSRNRAGRSP